MNDKLQTELNFKEFNRTTKIDWKAKAEKDLGGSEISTIYWHPFPDQQSFTLEPYYDKEDLADLDYLRRFHLSRSGSGSWKKYIILNAEIKSTREQIEELSGAGIDGIIMEIKSPTRNITKRINEQFTQSLNDQFSLGIKCLSVSSADLYNWISALNYPPHYIISKESYDVPGIEKVPMLDVSKYMCIISESPSAVQQLIDILVKINSILDKTLLKEADLKNIFSKVFLYSRTGPEFLVEVAKLRAARILIRALQAAYSVENEFEIEIVSESPLVSMEKYEPRGNMISSTYTAMSSIIGGCDTLVIDPGPGGHVSNRVASQVSNILREEAHLDKVADPSGGSYYIENLTHQLVTDSWQKFVEIQNNKINTNHKKEKE